MAQSIVAGFVLCCVGWAGDTDDFGRALADVTTVGF